MLLRGILHFTADKALPLPRLWAQDLDGAAYGGVSAYQKNFVIRAWIYLTPSGICTCLAVSTLLSETERAFMSASGDTVGKTSCKRATSGDS